MTTRPPEGRNEPERMPHWEEYRRSFVKIWTERFGLPIPLDRENHATEPFPEARYFIRSALSRLLGQTGCSEELRGFEDSALYLAKKYKVWFDEFAIGYFTFDGSPEPSPQLSKEVTEILRRRSDVLERREGIVLRSGEHGCIASERHQGSGGQDAEQFPDTCSREQPSV